MSGDPDAVVDRKLSMPSYIKTTTRHSCSTNRILLTDGASCMHKKKDAAITTLNSFSQSHTDFSLYHVHNNPIIFLTLLST